MASGDSFSSASVARPREGGHSQAALHLGARMRAPTRRNSGAHTYCPMLEKAKGPTWGQACLVNGLCIVGKLFRAEELVDVVEERGFEPNAVTYGAIIKGLVRTGKTSLALGLLKKWEGRRSCRVVVSTYNTVLDDLCKEGRLMEALKLFHRMIDQGVPPNVITYNTLIHARFESSDVLATFLSSTLLPFHSWRLCSLANTAAPGSFVVEQVGTVGYVAFSGIQVLPMGQLGSSGTGSGDLVPLDAASNGLFPAFKVHGGGEGEEEEETVVMVHGGMLQLFISFFASTDLHTKVSFMIFTWNVIFILSSIL
ncbi:hypothetical protein CRG98_021438 [Punica granatum]|uniref:Pentatricopeptide repeat-containing protein n=1 Tax=Punica granatum TaxID=22663 RepID=A0A2I0JQK0_PUNGR|nr:hypothetical protein CRG98_021438 [Punica granatum]